MGKKKASRANREQSVTNTIKPNSAGVQVSAEPMQEENYRWPFPFVPPQTALFIAGAVGVLAVIVFGASLLGGFTAVKILLASLLGVTSLEQVSSSNNDIALVLFGLGTVMLAGIVHPTLGIGLILLVRSWLDGYTFSLDNVYFTWSIYLLCILWLMHVFVYKTEIVFPIPAFIFFSMLLYLFAIRGFSDQYYNTCLLFWIWLGYGFLFLLSLNTTRDPRISGILMTIFLVGMGAQAVFSILHFEYLLPFLRRVVQDPAVLRRYFNTDVISPDMARRFMVNRAFGTMLFPNALAAYLILGIPFLLAMFKPYGRSCFDALKRGKTTKSPTLSSRERFLMMGVAAGMGIALVAVIHFIAYFPKEYIYRGVMVSLPFYLLPVPLAVFSLAAGCIFGAAVLYLLMRWGLGKWWLVTRFCGVICLLPILVYTLWITYSRGALLALLVALVWGGVLYCIKPGWFSGVKGRSVARGAVICLVALALLAALSFAGVQAGAQEGAWARETPANSSEASPAKTAPAAKPQADVRQEGINLSITDLADPASFRLRLGYWQVTLRMALDNLLTGVGMGNFAIAYPRYQHIGAGDVREAHNGFLQFFAETGLAGGLLFTAFWVFLGLWGAWRIVTEENKDEKLFLLGVYMGLIAFCLHAFLDINFSHPSLMMFAMAYTGLFYGRAMSPGNTKGQAEALPVRPDVRHRITTIMIPVLLVILLAAVGGNARIYLQQLALNRMRFFNLSCEDELNNYLRAGHFFFNELARYGMQREQGKKPAELPRTSLALARLLINDLEELAKGSTFYKPIPETPGHFARMEKGEPVPPNALVAVQKPWMMRRIAGEAALKWVQELEMQDRRFPHSPELAMNLAKWYEYYVQGFVGEAYSDRRPAWIEKFMDWSETMLKRNPKHADMRLIYANALVWKLLKEPGGEEEALLKGAEEQFEEMVRLSPILPRHRLAYAGVWERLADYFKEKSLDDREATCREKARELRREAQELQAFRNETHLYPME